MLYGVKTVPWVRIPPSPQPGNPSDFSKQRERFLSLDGEFAVTKDEVGTHGLDNFTPLGSGGFLKRQKRLVRIRKAVPDGLDQHVGAAEHSELFVDVTLLNEQPFPIAGQLILRDDLARAEEAQPL